MIDNIELPGLNNLQHAIADLLWWADDPELVRSYVLQQVTVVQELMLAAVIDQVVDQQFNSQDI